MANRRTLGIQLEELKVAEVIDDGVAREGRYPGGRHDPQNRRDEGR